MVRLRNQNYTVWLVNAMCVRVCVYNLQNNAKTLRNALMET